MFSYEPVTGEDLRAAAEMLGIEDFLHIDTIPILEQDGTYHVVGCADYIDEGADEELLTPGELTGTLCPCIAQDHFQAGGVPSPGDKFFQMALIHYHVTHKKSLLEHRVTRTTWLDLWKLTGGELAETAINATTSSIRVPWTKAQAELFQQVADRLYSQSLRPTAQWLTTRMTTELRQQTYQDFCRRFPTFYERGGQEDVLVGVDYVDLTRSSENLDLQDLVAVSAVHWSGSHAGLNFYRMPRWLYVRIRRGVVAYFRDSLHAVPWQENLPLDVIAALWTPERYCETSNLEAVIEIAQLL